MPNRVHLILTPQHGEGLALALSRVHANVRVVLDDVGVRDDRAIRGDEESGARRGFVRLGRLLVQAGSSDGA
jgi:hypothetical protein